MFIRFEILTFEAQIWGGQICQVRVMVHDLVEIKHGSPS